MGFDFTVAIVPRATNLTRELQYVKSALLYADKVRLISPMAYIFLQLTDKKNQTNEQTVLSLVNKIMPLAKMADLNFYNKNITIFTDFEQIVRSKKYRSVPFAQRLSIKNDMKDFALQIRNVVFNMIGLEECTELQNLIKNDQVIIENFKNSLEDLDMSVAEYFGMLNSAAKTSYPLFDEQSNDLMRTAVSAKIINLSETEKRRITHAGLADNYIHKLPSFEDATINEMLDIKKELRNPVVRFRSKMLSYSDGIQLLPWDNDFASECALLFDKEIAPAVLEIEEATKNNSFVKNLGKKFFTDEGAWKATGGLAMSIAAGGVLSSFTSVAAANAPAFAAGGAIAATKIAQAYSDYSQQKKEIEQKDLYFYYKAGKLLENS